MTVPDQGKGPGRGGPRAVGDLLGSLFATKGLARLHAVGELEAAWAESVGADAARQTQVGGVRHGVLTVTVAHPALLEELSAFRKSDLLAALRKTAPGATLQDLRFRVGPVETPGPPTPEQSRSQSRPRKPPKRGPA